MARRIATIPSALSLTIKISRQLRLTSPVKILDTYRKAYAFIN